MTDRILLMPAILIVLFTMLSTSSNASAQEVDQATIRNLAQYWLAQKSSTEKIKRTVREVKAIENTTAGITVYMVQLAPHGYVIFTADTRLPPILAFSLSNDLDVSSGPQNAFRTLLQQDLEQLKNNLATLIAAPNMSRSNNIANIASINKFITDNQQRWQLLLQNPDTIVNKTVAISSSAVGPLLTTSWNQNRYYNALAPSDPNSQPGSYYDGKVPVGCIQTAWGQLMKYYEWPPHGQGNSSYEDIWGLIQGTHSADYTDSYAWSNMLDAYEPFSGTYSDDQITAVSELMNELGVINQANYEAYESGGTSTISNLTGISNHLFYQNTHYTTTDIPNSLKTEINAHRPVVAGIPNHAIVVDGYSHESSGDFFHINYGWGGTNNGWYLLTDIPGGGLVGFYTAKPSYDPIIETADYVLDSTDISVEWNSPTKVSPAIDKFRISVTNDQYYGVWTDDAVDLSNWTTAPISGWESYQGQWQATLDNGKTTIYSGEHPDFIILKNIIVPEAEATLVLDYKIILNSGGRLAIAVSEDGLEWTTLYQETGSNTYNPVSKTQTIDLSTYAGKGLYLRISQEPVTSDHWSYWQGGGIWIDKITLNDIDNRLWSSVNNEVDATARSYTIRNAGSGVFQVRVESMVSGTWTGSGIKSVPIQSNTKLDQTIDSINFTPSTLLVGTTTVASAITNSSLPATFNSTTPLVCSTTGTYGATVTGLSSGTCTITASQIGNLHYNAAPSVSQSLTVAKGNQTIGTINFTPNTLTVGKTTTASATASSRLVVSFASTTPTICSIRGTTVTGLSAGTCTITASQAGNADYNVASSVSQNLTVAKSNQTIGGISFTPSTLTVNGTTTISATASSRLVVSFASTTPTVCSIRGTTVTGLSAGICIIMASQTGNADYNAAPSVSRNRRVGKGVQTISPVSFIPATLTVGGTTTVSATASSGLAVRFASTTPTVCSIRRASVTGLAAGTCTIMASQAGNTNYSAAPSVSQNLTVSRNRVP